MTKPPSHALTVISSAIANIAKGAAAWKRIAGTAAGLRDDWLSVGSALIDMKDIKNRPVNGTGSQGRETRMGFAEYAAVLFPGLTADYAGYAVWFFKITRTPTEILKKIPEGMSSPHSIRDWYMAQQATQALDAELSADLQDITVTPSAPVMDKRQAEKVAKVYNRAKSGGGGAETAAQKW